MDKFDAYQTFVRVVDAGSFSAAAASLGVAQPTVSKRVAGLEAELDAALLTRTTRRLALTEAGEAFYDAARSILDQVARGEEQVRRAGHEASGVLRVNLPLVFGQTCIAPTLPAFLAAHPGIELDLRLSDRFVDLVEAGVDLLVRIGVVSDSSLIARKLGVTRRRTVASPDYLARAGRPSRPHELAGHRCLVYSGSEDATRWSYVRGQERYRVQVEARVRADNGSVLRELALAGHGITRLASWSVGPDLQAGRLVCLLGDYEPPPLDVVALYPSARFLPRRARVFIEHLEQAFADHPYLS